jgi:GNAT superfamily N-acetyltransferase
MNRVVQMVKTLQEAAKPAAVEGFDLRSFEDPRDLAGWLALRQRTFAREKLGVRDWGETDFRQEFSSKPWWNPQNCWLIQTNQAQSSLKIPVLSNIGSASLGNNEIVGSVTLAMRTGTKADRAVVHWLMVHPRYRSRGLGRWLLAILEAKAWELGHREVYLETHSAWEAASRFYLAAGYEPVRAEEAD